MVRWHVFTKERDFESLSHCQHNSTKLFLSGPLSNHATRNYKEIENNLQKKSAFTVKKTADGITVEHTHNSSDNDMVYLISSHIDQYWRTGKVEWFRAMLPIGYTQPIKNILANFNFA
jgi:hypothetical protein